MLRIGMLLIALLAAPAARADSVIANLLAQYPSVNTMLISLAYVIGTVLVVTGVFLLKKNALDSERYPLGRSIMTLVVGSCLLSLPLVSEVIQRSIFGGGALTTLAIDENMERMGNNGVFDIFNDLISANMGKALVGFIMLVGLISLIKGLIMLRDIGRSLHEGQQGSGIGKAFTHIIGGSVCLNLIQTSCVIADTLGFQAICLAG